MGWFSKRGQRRRQAELDAVTAAFGLHDPKLRENYERSRDLSRQAQQAELRRREREGLDVFGNPQESRGDE